MPPLCYRRRGVASAALYLDSQAAARGFPVFGVDVFAGFVHGFNHLVQETRGAEVRCSAIRAALIAFTEAMALRSMHGTCT